MGEDIEVKGRISIDTGDSAAKIGGVKDAIKGANAEGSASSGMFSKLKSELGGVAGPATQATGSLGGLNTALNVLRANPIVGIFVLIAGLVVALFGHFKKMEGVSDSLGKAWASLSGIFEVFMNYILKPLIDGFSTLMDWITKAAQWIVGLFSPATAAASKELGKLAEEMDDLNDQEIKNNLVRAESKRRLAEAKEAAADANIPIKDRIAALKEAAKIEKETLEESIKVNEARGRNVLATIALELGAREELVKKIREGSDAEVAAARNELLDMKHINKDKIIEADKYLNDAADQKRELANVGKKALVSENNLQKQGEKEKEDIAKEYAERRKKAEEKAAAELKERLANQLAFEEKELKKQQEIELGYITETQEKELTVLMNVYQAEIKANKRALEEKKITRDQYSTLMRQDLELFRQKEAAINKKYDEEAKKKEEEAQAALNKLQEEARKADLKEAEDARKIFNKLALDKINFEIANATKDLNLTKKLLSDKRLELQHQYEWEINNAKLTNAEKLALEQKHVEDLAGIASAEMSIAEQKKDHQQKILAATGELLAQGAELAGKHTVAGKAMAVASTAIATYQSAMGAFRGMVTSIPGPVGIALGAAAAALAAATGIANIKKIVSTQVPGQGSGGGSVPSISTPAPVTPQRTTTQLNAASIQGIGNAAAGGVNRAFVLEADINNNGERTRRINRAARLN